MSRVLKVFHILLLLSGVGQKLYAINSVVTIDNSTDMAALQKELDSFTAGADLFLNFIAKRNIEPSTPPLDLSHLNSLTITGSINFAPIIGLIPPRNIVVVDESFFNLRAIFPYFPPNKSSPKVLQTVALTANGSGWIVFDGEEIEPDSQNLTINGNVISKVKFGRPEKRFETITLNRLDSFLRIDTGASCYCKNFIVLQESTLFLGEETACNVENNVIAYNSLAVQSDGGSIIMPAALREHLSFSDGIIPENKKDLDTYNIEGNYNIISLSPVTSKKPELKAAPWAEVLNIFIKEIRGTTAGGEIPDTLTLQSLNTSIANSHNSLNDSLRKVSGDCARKISALQADMTSIAKAQGDVENAHRIAQADLCLRLDRIEGMLMLLMQQQQGG